MKQQYEWHEYYEQFKYLGHSIVRDGCHPRYMEHPTAQKAIVLIHGLTDSPYFLTAIAEVFHYELGYNVYLPLLRGHGLAHPKNMQEVTLEKWKDNVLFALETATTRAAIISIGGLSLGGNLSLFFAENSDHVNGDLFLFSAALDLAGGIWGDFKEYFLRSKFIGIADYFEKDKPLIGPNPYRYDRFDMTGAKCLAQLIKETDQIISAADTSPFSKRVFAAHSESDTTASIEGVERFLQKCIPEKATFFRLPKEKEVKHASLALKDPIIGTNGSDILEAANPHFNEMIQSMKTFVTEASNP